jgi:hypothetical protein
MVGSASGCVWLGCRAICRNAVALRRSLVWMASPRSRKPVDGPALLRPLPQDRQPRNYLWEPRAARGCTMPHRHYGIPILKLRPTDSGPTRAAAWSRGAIIGGIMLFVIVLGLMIYGVSKIVAHAGNITTSAPHTTGEENSRRNRGSQWVGAVAAGGECVQGYKSSNKMNRQSASQRNKCADPPVCPQCRAVMKIMNIDANVTQKGLLAVTQKGLLAYECPQFGRLTVCRTALRSFPNGVETNGSVCRIRGLRQSLHGYGFF